MAKPTEEYQWAKEPGANINLPDSERFNNGWTANVVPISGWQNYMMNSHGKWIGYLDGEIDSLKTGGTTEIFYLTGTADLVSGVGDVFECSVITATGTGQKLLQIPDIKINELPDGTNPYYLAPCDITGVLTGVWPSTLPTGVIDVSYTRATTGTNQAVRKYLSWNESAGGVFIVYNSDWTNWDNPTSSFTPNILAGIYNAL